MRALHLLTSVDTFKTIIEKTSTANDNIIFNFVSQASSDIERYTGRKLRGRTYGANGLDPEYHNGTSTGKLYVKEYPIISVTSLHDDTNRDFTSTSLKASDEYILWKDQGIIQLFSDAVNGSLFNTGISNIKLVYTAGYDEHEIITGVNDKIDFNDGSVGVGTLSGGIYTSIELATEVQTKLDTASTDTITCSFDSYTAKYIITSDGTTYSLLWGTGANSNTSPGRTLGYDVVTNDTGALTYTGDYSVVGIPSDLEQACLELTLQKFEESRFGSNRFNIKTQQTIGQHAGMTTFGSIKIPESVERVIKLYKRVIV